MLPYWLPETTCRKARCYGLVAQRTQRKNGAMWMSAIGVLLCDDLIFTSRVTGTARALGLELRIARNVAALDEIAKQQAPACVILDLHNPGLDVRALVAALRQGSACTVVGYGSH